MPLASGLPDFTSSSVPTCGLSQEEVCTLSDSFAHFQGPMKRMPLLCRRIWHLVCFWPDVTASSEELRTKVTFISFQRTCLSYENSTSGALSVSICLCISKNKNLTVLDFHKSMTKQTPSLILHLEYI